MRITNLIPLALPLLASAQQIPLLNEAKDLLAYGQSWLSGTAHQAARPVTSRISNAAVHDLTIDNWKQTLVHSGSAQAGDSSEPWFVLLSGRNKTCGGRCEGLETAWDEAVTVLAADPTGPHLAYINCDDEEILCGAWAAVVSQVWVFQVPHPSPNQSPAPVPLTIFALNYTTVTPQDIISIHTEKKYQDVNAEQYDGAFHPFDGWVAKFGLTLPMAYGLYAMAKIPSWAFMIFLSFFSRYFVSKRMPNGAPPFARPAPAPGAAPAGGARPAR